MEFSELIRTRRSCRHYTDEPVSRAEIEAILTEANLSASACNSQPWHYTVLLSRESRAAGAEAVQIFPNVNLFASDAAALIVLSVDKDPAVMSGVRGHFGSSKFAEIDAGSAAAYLTLAAADKGLGTCIMGAFDEEKVIRAAALPDTVIPKLVIALGHPADNDRPHTKKRDDIAGKTVVL